MGIQPNKQSRPFGWRFLQLGCAVIVLRGVGRVWVALTALDRYQSLEHTPPIALYSVYNMGWSLVFGWVLLQLWQRKLLRWQLWGCLVALVVSDTVWTLSFVPDNYEQQRLPFRIGVWLFVLSILYLMTRRDAFSDFATRRKLKYDRPS